MKRLLFISLLFLASCGLDEPYNGCTLAAIKHKAELNQHVVDGKRFLGPLVESHLLAIEWEHGGHMALIIRGEHRWFAWDDGYGGRELFKLPYTKELPSPITTAEAAFPGKKVELAWWCDEEPLK